MESSSRSKEIKARITSIEPDSSEDSANPVREFAPYDSYVIRSNQLTEFIQLTSTSYKLAQQLLFSTPDDQLVDVKPRVMKPTEWSYSMADVKQIGSVTMRAGWLQYAEYAEHEGVTPEEIKKRAESGQLGTIKVHSSDGAPIILWPPEAHRPEDFRVPEPGSYSFVVTQQMTVTVDDEREFDLSDPHQLEEARTYYLRLAHALGQADEVAARAEEILFRAAFLLQWGSFETFLRETIEYLLSKYPQVIIQSVGKKTTLSYEQIFEMSGQLSSIDDLRRDLIDLEIQRLRAGGRSIHGQINFLKSAFHFKDDPYKAWYVVKGERREATYETLLAIKGRRNVLVHEAEPMQDEATTRAFDKVTQEEYFEAQLALRSVAYSIAFSVHNEKFDVSRAAKNQMVDEEP
jgi:hypothetical protein